MRQGGHATRTVNTHNDDRHLGNGPGVQHLLSRHTNSHTSRGATNGRTHSLMTTLELGTTSGSNDRLGRRTRLHRHRGKVVNTQRGRRHANHRVNRHTQNSSAVNHHSTRRNGIHHGDHFLFNTVRGPTNGHLRRVHLVNYHRRTRRKHKLLSGQRLRDELNGRTRKHTNSRRLLRNALRTIKATQRRRCRVNVNL